VYFGIPPSKLKLEQAAYLAGLLQGASKFDPTDKTPGGGYDQIQASGTLSLGGTLAVSLINGFTPVAGNSFDILEWGNRNAGRNGIRW
jgi:hypothetical protein